MNAPTNRDWSKWVAHKSNKDLWIEANEKKEEKMSLDERLEKTIKELDRRDALLFSNIKS